MNLCIHGHFYQPPREDPISNYIPSEIGAEPYRNWNEKIMAECYEPNVLAGNFGKISFNIGPTLYRWMWSYKPEIAQKIADQERANFEKFGVGNGMAQSCHHTILPLATPEDKITQVYWGIADFEYRFGHKPEGIWLAETGADLDTLCVLSDQGLKFTILAPWQVGSVDGKPGPYLVDLPGGREPFVVFPYHRELSTMVSFLPESTENGDRFLSTVREKLSQDPAGLNVIASDGELYGHHQEFRDIFLTYVVNSGEHYRDINWTYPGKWLLENKVTARAMLVSPSSWSCFHGVDRWKKECACTPGAHWKEPLYRSLCGIAGWIDERYVSFMSGFVDNPWQFRNKYVRVFNGQQALADLLTEEGGSNFSISDLEKINTLMKAQVKRQRMFSSCGWFHQEFHRIEPQNNIAYAAMAVWLTEMVTGEHIDLELISALTEVRDKKSGLRADSVFTQTVMRAKNEA
ncbi:MAG: DUF3536 domain-containing protein [Anaerolineaceae bacterium]|nr:DUF3536 domain-containing protein [Anaerolineaceae bacterium]MDD4041945.1 DUF3536 domain-containing protein [Anaerolineaceae bacterium]MDD4578128.1 DUF3536 domain-containing protein [Anaerolineaceae bacterium]